MAERIAEEHVRWLDRRREGYDHVWRALALAQHTTAFALKLAHPRLQDALAAAWLMLPQ